MHQIGMLGHLRSQGVFCRPGSAAVDLTRMRLKRARITPQPQRVKTHFQHIFWQIAPSNTICLGTISLMAGSYADYCCSSSRKMLSCVPNSQKTSWSSSSCRCVGTEKHNLQRLAFDIDGIISETQIQLQLNTAEVSRSSNCITLKHSVLIVDEIAGRQPRRVRRMRVCCSRNIAGEQAISTR